LPAKHLSGGYFRQTLRPQGSAVNLYSPQAKLGSDSQESLLFAGFFMAVIKINGQGLNPANPYYLDRINMGITLQVCT